MPVRCSKRTAAFTVMAMAPKMRRRFSVGFQGGIPLVGPVVLDQLVHGLGPVALGVGSPGVVSWISPARHLRQPCAPVDTW